MKELLNNAEKRRKKSKVNIEKLKINITRQEWGEKHRCHG